MHIDVCGYNQYNFFRGLNFKVCQDIIAPELWDKELVLSKVTSLLQISALKFKPPKNGLAKQMLE